MSATTTIALVELLDEFSFEQDYVQVPATLQALRARERVILVQDESCEYVVTLERGRALKLWNPEMHWADQESEQMNGRALWAKFGKAAINVVKARPVEGANLARIAVSSSVECGGRDARRA